MYSVYLYVYILYMYIYMCTYKIYVHTNMGIPDASVVKNLPVM